MTANSFKIVVGSLVLPAVALLGGASGSLRQAPADENGRDPSSLDKKGLERFEEQVDDFRAQLRIPGISAVIIRDQETLWAKGFGFADFENRTPATPDTLYHIASLTKTFSSTLIMQLVEQGKLNLDEPISRYSSDFKDDSVKIKHLLSHTSDGPPGEHYRYDGNRYDTLTAVIEKKTGKPFVEVIVDTFFDPLAMSSSVPVHNIVDEADRWAGTLGKENIDRYRKSLSKLAQPYTLYGDGEVIHVPYPPKGSIGAAAGLLSTVLDMARYDVAIDRHVYLKKETQEKAWTAFISNKGQPLPHGLGWFVTEYQGTRLIWHFGNWGTGFSAIYLKVPERSLSLVVLGNSEAVSDHQFQVGDDITNNVFACSFLRLFVLKESKGHGYDCERNSQKAMSKWLEIRRKNARKAVRLDPRLLERYVGHYRSETPPNRLLTVKREGDRLFADIPRDSISELFAESESRFFLKVRRFQVVFIRKQGRVTHLEVVSDDGQRLRAKRID